MRWMMTGIALVAACAAAGPRAALWPPDPAHVVRITVGKEALAQLESLATVTRQTRREQVACAVESAALPVGRNGWIIAVIEIGPGLVTFKSDSLGVTWDGQMCRPDEPNVHSHIVENDVWGRPSDYDTLQVRIARGHGDRAPFHILVSVGPKAPSLITIYGLR